MNDSSLQREKAALSELKPFVASGATLAEIYAALLARDQDGKRFLEDFLAEFNPPHTPNLELPKSISFQDAASVYDGLLGLNNAKRKKSGAYYTPLHFAQNLLRKARPTVSATEPRILDPACGAGRFLLAALREFGQGAKLYGCDTDPLAAALCRISLAISINASPAEWRGLNERIQVADSLLEFPFEQASFDLIVGNPPFKNAIEGMGNDLTRQARKAVYPEVTGAADLSVYFMALALRAIEPTGGVAMVLPRNFLGSPTAEKLRKSIADNLGVHTIASHEPTKAGATSKVFSAAAIQSIGVVFSKTDRTRLDWGSGQIDIPSIASSNWWPPIADAIWDLEPPPAGSPLGATFQVAGGLTVSEAYDIRPYVEESSGESGELKLITTGLIDPATNHWGERLCRFLGQKYKRPIVRNDAPFPHRTGLARRPKILVAGLSKRPEAFLDRTGGCFGSVSTFTIIHPNDDVGALEELLTFLLSDSVYHEYLRQLGWSAVGGGDYVMRKAFLKNLLIPAPKG